MKVYVPTPNQAAHKGKDGRFGGNDFRYDAEDDTYVCPAGERLARSGSTTKNGKLYFAYRSDPADCQACSLSDRCLAKGKSRREVQCWEHEDVMDRHRGKMSASASLMRERGALVEHPFGTLKRWAGMDQFLMRGLRKCRGEFSLMTLGYNLERVMSVLGEAALAEHCLQKQGLATIGA